MKTKLTKTIKTRTWYGMGATVTIGSGFIHRAGLGGLLIPHPPVINWLLRQGLTEKARYTLCCTHEIGHLESLPLAVLYTAVNLAILFATGQVSLIKIILVLISAQAVWEIISELFTKTGSAQLYRKSYEGVRIIPRTIFWVSSIALTLMGWIIALA